MASAANANPGRELAKLRLLEYVLAVLLLVGMLHPARHW